MASLLFLLALTAGVSGCSAAAVTSGPSVSSQAPEAASSGTTPAVAPATTATTISEIEAARELGFDAARTAAYVAAARSLSLTGEVVKTRTIDQGGVMARAGGAVKLRNMQVVTSGSYAPPLATLDDGSITVVGGSCEATDSEGVAIDGGGTVAMTNAALSVKRHHCAVMLYHFEDAGGTAGSFSMTGGSLVYSTRSGSLFYVTNGSAAISLSRVQVVAMTSTLLTVQAGIWGVAGANGGSVSLTADHQDLIGDVVADALSSVELTLTDHSSLKGAINAAGTAVAATLSLSGGSTWYVTADSHLTGLSLGKADLSGGSIKDIRGGGHTVYYDAASPPNAALGGKTYRLNGGGTLTPEQG